MLSGDWDIPPSEGLEPQHQDQRSPEIHTHPSEGSEHSQLHFSHVNRYAMHKTLSGPHFEEPLPQLLTHPLYFSLNANSAMREVASLAAEHFAHERESLQHL